MTNDEGEIRAVLEGKLLAAWPLAQWADVRIVVAVSGGPDSVALLRAVLAVRPAASLKRTLVAHFNHGLRGVESDGDEQFVRQLAETHGVAAKGGRESLASVRTGDGKMVLAKDSRPLSEESLRDERYAFLLKTAHEFGARYLLTGHTADDQAETVLFRLLRGTGLSGLAGIPRLRALSEAVTLVRPLLDVRRGEVLEYLRQLNQPYRIDSSNVSSQYARNRLRNELLPQLAADYSPQIVENLLALAQQAAEASDESRAVARWLIERACEQIDGGIVIHLERLPANFPRRFLREMFVKLWREQSWPRGEMTFERWDELAEMLDVESATWMFPGEITAQKKAASIWLTRPSG